MKDLERRAFAQGTFRVEARADGKAIIQGHAAVFNQKSEIFGFTEEVAPGAFAQSIGEDDIRALFNHDDNLVLGRNTAGTLVLAEDAIGLRSEIEPPDTQFARDLLTSIRRGDISGMSIGFTTRHDEWRTVDGLPHRILKRAQLWDVSPVTFPAFPQTDVGIAMRSLGEHLKREAQAQAAPALALELELRARRVRRVQIFSSLR